jgi:molybdate transport system substrate-binding protein
MTWILIGNGAAQAAEIQLAGPGFFKGLLGHFGPQFQKATGNRVVLVKRGSGGRLKRQIESGQKFDIAILPSRFMDALIKSGKIAAGSRTDIGRTGLGLAVDQGGPKPVINSVDAFKRALLNAKSILHSKGGTGRRFIAVVNRLGIAEDMKSKLKRNKSGSTLRALAKGRAQFAVSNVSAILGNSAIVDYVGPLPGRLQTWSVYSAGISSAAKDPKGARDFIKFITTSKAVSVLKAKGLEPLAR